jgi:hypothetical protein
MQQKCSSVFPCDSIRPRRGGHGSENPGSLDAGDAMRSTHLPGAMIAVPASDMSLPCSPSAAA